MIGTPFAWLTAIGTVQKMTQVGNASFMKNGALLIAVSSAKTWAENNEA